jgi:hypothetical protein
VKRTRVKQKTRHLSEGIKCSGRANHQRSGKSPEKQTRTFEREGRVAERLQENYRVNNARAKAFKNTMSEQSLLQPEISW